MSERARYQVRTPIALWITNGALVGLCATLVAALVLYGSAPASLLLLAAVLCSATIAFWFSMSAYRVGGGRNLIRFFDDRLEVPAVRERKPLVFARDGLAMSVRSVQVQYRLAALPLANVRRGHLIELRAGGVARTFSTLVLEDRRDEPALLSDLERFAAGQPALGRDGHDAPAPRSEYDDRLDRELARLD